MLLIRKIRRSLEREGWAGTVRLIAFNMVRLPYRIQKSHVEDPFDKKYGLETEGCVSLSELQIDSPSYPFGISYSPVRCTRFQAAMRVLQIDHARFTFVDLGSGKGRALLLAAAWPFEKIIGVEFSPELCKIADRNVARFTGPKLCQNITSVCADAATFRFPLTPIVVFMYHPFVEKILAEVVKNIEDSLRTKARDIYLLYVNPRFEETIVRSSYFRPIVSSRLHSVFQGMLPPQRK